MKKNKNKSCCSSIELIEPVSTEENSASQQGGCCSQSASQEPSLSKDSIDNTSKSGGTWLGIGAVGIALLSGVGCCGLPLLSSALVALGVGSGILAELRPYQPYLIGLAVVVLAYEFYKAYRPMPESTCCSRKRKRIILWSVSLMMVVSLIIQLKANAPDHSKNSPEAISEPISGQAPAPCCP